MSQVMEVTKVMQVMKARGYRDRGMSLLAFLTSITSIAFITFVTSSSAFAAEDRPFAAPQVARGGASSTAGGLAQVTLSLVLVLAAVFAAAWVVRKLRGYGRLGRGAIEVVADVALGTKERAVLVQVGGQQLLLGVAAGHVNLLHVLPDPVVVAADRPIAADAQSGMSDAQTPDFKAILKRSLGLK